MFHGTGEAGGNKSTFNVDNVGYSTSATAPGMTLGDITPTGCSVGTRQGFSIIKYDGKGTATSILMDSHKHQNFCLSKILIVLTTAVYHKVPI